MVTVEERHRIDATFATRLIARGPPEIQEYRVTDRFSMVVTCNYVYAPISLGRKARRI